MIRRIVPALLLLAAIPCLAAPSPPDPNEEATVNWLRAHAVPLRTVEAGHGFADMQPIKRMVGDARIVALGEATHGTREFFQLKHRMLEFLATEMGFNYFAIEANLPEAYRVNEFVLTGKGDPKALLKGMYFWTWNTEEVLDMILWMREFNRSGKGRVQFTGFDMQYPDVAAGIARDFVAKAEPGYLTEVDSTFADVRKLRGQASPAPNFGVATSRFPIRDFAGKKVRYRGWIRTEGVTRGWAGLWWRVDGDSGALAFDNMQDRGASGTTRWKQYEIELDVPRNGTNVVFGALHTGDGTAWFDGLDVSLDGAPYVPTGSAPPDLGFESPTAKGFYTGGKGYQVAIDTTQAEQGRQCLMMRHTDNADTASAAPPVDARAVSQRWAAVVEHLRVSRETYARGGAGREETEWAIENARVAHQCAQAAAKERSRDQSMAENVKWILDQAGPKAKIVLWAHNAHVSRAGREGFDPMGRYLTEAYPGKMVVFGFAFDRGSFRAVEPGHGLREFTVGPAASGTVDSLLGATGIPIGAVDLRRLPRTGAAATWLRSPHRTRDVGAVYSEDSPDDYYWDATMTDFYDAILFVDRTTAARGNPEPPKK